MDTTTIVAGVAIASAIVSPIVSGAVVRVQVQQLKEELAELRKVLFSDGGYERRLTRLETVCEECRRHKDGGPDAAA